MKRLTKIAEDVEMLESLLADLIKFEEDILNKIDKTLEDNSDLISDLSMNSLHTEYEKDVDVLINENRENLNYTRNKLDQIKQRIGEKTNRGEEIE